MSSFIYLFLAVSSLTCRMQDLPLWCADFSSCGIWAQELQYTGLVVPRQGESSQTRDRTHVPQLADRFLTTGSPRKLLHFILQCDTHTFTHIHAHPATKLYIILTFLYAMHSETFFSTISSIPYSLMPVMAC